MGRETDDGTPARIGGVTDLRNITRRDQKGQGYQVKFVRVIGGQKHVAQHWFSDKAYGSREAAFAAAVAWRDKGQAQLPACRRGAAPPALGSGGVRRRVHRKNGKEFLQFIARIRLEDGAVQKTFNASAWGEEGAKAMAERWLRAERRALAERRGK